MAENNFYAIVDFEDGMQIICVSWMSDDETTAYWPRYTNMKRYYKAVRNMERAEETWIKVPIKSIIARSRKFIELYNNSRILYD